MEGKSVAGICLGILEGLAYFVKQALWDTPMDLLFFLFSCLLIRGSSHNGELMESVGCELAEMNEW
jgi:hypothetical protein